MGPMTQASPMWHGEARQAGFEERAALPGDPGALRRPLCTAVRTQLVESSISLSPGWLSLRSSAVCVRSGMCGSGGLKMALPKAPCCEQQLPCRPHCTCLTPACPPSSTQRPPVPLMIVGTPFFVSPGAQHSLRAQSPWEGLVPIAPPDQTVSLGEQSVACPHLH